MSIRVAAIAKSYAEQKALDGISFEIEKGEIVGFLGPNGAGKSTLMKILTTYICADTGNASVNDFDVKTQKKQVQQSIGYLPEHNPLYLELYVREYLEFCAKAHGIKDKKTRIAAVIQQTGLQAHAHKKITALSKGYRQRVGLAAALLHDPKVLILDEPTTGLDPNQLLEIRALIKSLSKEKTILLSTHIMQEVEALCDRVLILHQGQLVKDTKIQSLKADQKQVLEVTFDYRIEQVALQRLAHLEKAINTHAFDWELHFTTQQDQRATIFDFAQKNGLKILKLNTQNKSLESLFRELTATKNL